MAAAKKALTEILDSLGLSRRLLERAQHRYGVQHQRAIENHKAQKVAQGKADHFRRESDTTTADKYDAKARRCSQRAYKSHLKAQAWIGRIKTLTVRIEGLEADRTRREIELRELRKTVKIKGNTATGGSKPERLKTLALESAKRCAAGRRRNFYSQTGAWDVKHCLTGESYGERSDCSSWATSVYNSAGLPDPNGENFGGGYTGTLGDHGREVSRASLKPGDLVLYGPKPHHHVEMYVGPGEKTIGHGSSPVDPGVIDLFGDGDYTLRTYV